MATRSKPPERSLTCSRRGCGSYAINLHHHGRDNTRTDLCDVCYWRDKNERADLVLATLSDMVLGEAGSRSHEALIRGVRKLLNNLSELRASKR